jgi:hypothetical protein
MCFFRNKDNQLCKLFFGVPEAIEHIGNVIAGEVFAVLHAFSIGPDRIGYFIFDNAENNTIAMVVISGESRRGRCIGHTINLAAKASILIQGVG